MRSRHKPARGVYISLGLPTIVFVTVCSLGRRPWLAQAKVMRELVEVWTESRAWPVGAFLLMPDHLHFFCAPGDLSIPLNRWMSYWKRRFSGKSMEPAWRLQPNHWDTRLRREESYARKWEYVRYNPVRAGLVTDPDSWPYQGVLSNLRW